MTQMPQPDQAGDGEPSDLPKADLPDAQSLRDALRQWKNGDDPAVAVAQDQSSRSVATDTASAGTPASPWADAGSKGSSSEPTQPLTDSPESKARPVANDKSKPVRSKKKVPRNQARRFARQRAVQAIYQWEHGHVEVGDVLQQFAEFQNLSNVDLDHFQRLFRGVAVSVDKVDALMEHALDRPVTDLDPIERSILRMATVELRDCLQTPARVVINEAVELTKRFGADQGHKYVNGVIDKVALSLRDTEMKAGKKS